MSRLVESLTLLQGGHSVVVDRVGCQFSGQCSTDCSFSLGEPPLQWCLLLDEPEEPVKGLSGQTTKGSRQAHCGWPRR